MDPYKFLNITRNSDGTLDRSSSLASLTTPNSSLSKDLPLNPSLHTSIRIFHPNRDPNPNSPLPIILFFHGGGFILFSSSSTFFHNSCTILATQIPALIISVDYRLAPEHRLPAAYDDAIDALLWLKSQSQNPNDPWLSSGIDFSRCFLMGSSSGANIAYQAGLRATEMDLEPLKIAGIIMNQPYFGGIERTESEKTMVDDKIVPLAANDLMWELALPEGMDRDHEYSNPGKGDVVRMRKLGRCLVRGYLGDPLVDRAREIGRMLEREGVRVDLKVDLEGHHGIELLKEEKLEELVEDVRSRPF
ncbi:Carboxylesterase protein [Dioscorea alata]|uniref:Carboxylesterase protein n=1 Tax=Dioscorea alata TaxID=55571 RepID=A0ACB7UH60_DIOAL|nr:Carboxylesterase protein [Dioscorea alata]